MPKSDIHRAAHIVVVATLQVTSTLTERISEVKHVLYGEIDKDTPVNPATCGDIGEWFVRLDLFQNLISKLPTLPFETRKEVAQIFTNLARGNHGNFAKGYLVETPDIVGLLVEGYSNPTIALNVGSMLRESLRYEALCRHLLYSEHLKTIMTSYVHVSNFEVASDAFATFKEAMTRHKALAAKFLDEEFDTVFELYAGLLNSKNYVTRRQSLKLLGELLLDRNNFNVMMRYIGDRNNLKTIMIMLRDKRTNIQFEAFHVFKVFVANPKKPDSITAILVQNRDKLVEYLRKFHNDKDDAQFTEEKALLIQKLLKMKTPGAKSAKAEAETKAAAAEAPSASAPATDAESSAAGDPAGAGGPSA